jgi:hypothetical protein
MDVHCNYAPDYVERCVAALERTGADNVGGAQRCRARTPFEKALCAALGSPLGMGGAAYRDAAKEGYVDTVFLGAFRRRVLDRLGGWDAAAVTNEDAELNQRLIESGGRIFLSSEINVGYYPRGTAFGLARQYLRYGEGRARTLLKHGHFLRLRPALPFLAGLAGLAGSVLKPTWTALAGVAYAVATLSEAVRLSRRFDAPVATTWLVFPVMHVSHAIGFGSGLIRYLLRPNWKRG